MSRIDALLSRLERVKPNGVDRWLACCPAHADGSPSLSVRQVEDGRILLHCFAGCGAADVMAAIGLQLTDLFEQAMAPHLAAVRRRDLGVSALDVMYGLRRECLILGFIASGIAEGTADPVLCERAGVAAQRIYYALSLCDG